MWRYSTCYMRVVCYSWLPQLLVNTTPSSTRKAGVLLLMEKAALSTALESRKRICLWNIDETIQPFFCCKTEVHFFRKRSRREMSLILCLCFCMLFLLFFLTELLLVSAQRGEMNIALLKIYHPATPTTLNRHIRWSERELATTESDSGLSSSVYTDTTQTPS